MAEALQNRIDQLTTTIRNCESSIAESQKLLGEIDAKIHQAEAAASVGTGLSVTVRRGEVETLEYQRDRSFTVTVYFGHRKGSASTSDLSSGAIGESVDKACSIARYTAEDRFAGLADARLMAKDPQDLYLDRPWSLTPDEAIALATECEAVGMAVDGRITNSEGGSVNTGRGVRVYGNSHGSNPNLD